MSGREFTWSEYDVAIPAPLVREVRSLVTVPEATERALAAAEPGLLRVRIPIPDLAEHPTPMAKARILLESAAEIEHALMVQYLYAAYSLKDRSEVDPAHRDLLDDRLESSWPQILRAIAREEMGHFMTVQNLLILLGLAPNFDREDAGGRDDLYPFKLKLQPVTLKSLAKYVVAEAPGNAEGIEEIKELASEKAGATINRVGILYGLLGMVFCRQDQATGGATGHPSWDAIVRMVADAAYQQDDDRRAWHLPESDFHAETLQRQADPADWQVGQVRVHRAAERMAALHAIRDIGEQGEGPTGGDEQSHFERFLGIYRAFPAPEEWVPTRPVPINPDLGAFTTRTGRWAALADARYGLLLGFLDHYLHAPDDLRGTLTGWIFAEMRSRLGFIARKLTELPATDLPASDAVGACPFTLPTPLALPDSDAARWRVHIKRTTDAIAIIEQIRDGPEPEDLAGFLTRLMASDRARLQTMQAQSRATSFARDIEPLFRPVDIDHMGFALNLTDLEEVKTNAESILAKLELDDAGGAIGDRMPIPPDPRWTPCQVALLRQWIEDGWPS